MMSFFREGEGGGEVEGGSLYLNTKYFFHLYCVQRKSLSFCFKISKKLIATIKKSFLFRMASKRF